MKLLLYCTKSKPYLYREDDDTFKLENKQLYEDISEYKKHYGLNNGKIVAECDFEVEEIECRISIGINGIHDEYTTKSLGENELLYASKIDEITFINYLKGKNGYAIHIKNLNIFDKPKELSDYYRFDGVYNNINNWKCIDKAPQNMMYAYELISELGWSGTYNGHFEKKIIISIRPEWMCLILNKDKDVEVRKKVLKEMIE